MGGGGSNPCSGFSGPYRKCPLKSFFMASPSLSKLSFTFIISAEIKVEIVFHKRNIKKYKCNMNIFFFQPYEALISNFFFKEILGKSMYYLFQPLIKQEVFFSVQQEGFQIKNKLHNILKIYLFIIPWLDETYLVF